MQLSIDNKKPMGNGVITCLNLKQAEARTKKGKEAAKAIKMVLDNEISTQFIEGLKLENLKC